MKQIDQCTPRMRRLLRMAIGLRRRRQRLRPELYAHQAERLKRLGHGAGFGPLAAHAFGAAQQECHQPLEVWWWVFMNPAV
jgi:hypothetical protein